MTMKKTFDIHNSLAQSNGEISHGNCWPNDHDTVINSWTYLNISQFPQKGTINLKTSRINDLSTFEKKEMSA